MTARRLASAFAEGIEPSPSSEVHATCEWNLLLATTNYFVEEDDPALTDDPDKSDEEIAALRKGKSPAKADGNGATNGISVIGLAGKNANDVGNGPLDEATRNKRLSNREMHKKILIFLLARYEKMTIDRARDVLHDAVVRALCNPSWPLDAARTTPWLYTIARRTHVDDIRKRVRRDGVEVSTPDYAGKEPVTLLETEAILLRELLEWLDKNKPEIAKGLRIHLQVLAGASMEEAAAEEGIAVSTAYKLVKIALDYIDAHKAELFAVSVAAFAMIFLLIHTGESPQGVSGAGVDVRADEPLPALPPHRDVQEVRARGMALCADHHYEGCLRLLNRARRADPAGDKDPGVTAARRNAEEVVRRREKESAP